MNLGIQGERERKQKANKTNETRTLAFCLLGVWEHLNSFRPCSSPLAGPAPGAPAHPTFSNLPAESGAPHEGQRVLRVFSTQPLPISHPALPFPRSLSPHPSLNPLPWSGQRWEGVRWASQLRERKWLFLALSRWGSK